MLPFAKRGDERGNNLVRLQQMFPRIVAADFEHPMHVSQECRHMLGRMLTADPAQRITIAEIMQHPWYVCSCLLWLACAWDFLGQGDANAKICADSWSTASGLGGGGRLGSRGGLFWS